jgi:hypothetical protein
VTDNKAAPATLAEVSTFLFAALNGHLFSVAPPASRVGGLPADLAVGIASFAALLVFFVVKSYVTPWKHRRAFWLVMATLLTGLYLIAALRYGGGLNRNTFVYSPDPETRTVEVVGNDYTNVGKQMAANFRRKYRAEPLPGELLQYGGGYDPGKITELWTARSVVRAHNQMVYRYLTMVVLLAMAIASLIQLSMVSPKAPVAQDPNKEPRSLGVTLGATKLAALVSKRSSKQPSPPAAR